MTAPSKQPEAMRAYMRQYMRDYRAQLPRRALRIGSPEHAMHMSERRSTAIPGHCRRCGDMATTTPCERCINDARRRKAA